MNIKKRPILRLVKFSIIFIGSHCAFAVNETPSPIKIAAIMNMKINNVRNKFCRRKRRRHSVSTSRRCSVFRWKRFRVFFMGRCELRCWILSFPMMMNSCLFVSRSRRFTSEVRGRTGLLQCCRMLRIKRNWSKQEVSSSRMYRMSCARRSQRSRATWNRLTMARLRSRSWHHASSA